MWEADTLPTEPTRHGWFRPNIRYWVHAPGFGSTSFLFIFFLSKAGLTLNHFQLVTSCDCPPQRRPSNDIVKCETLCDSNRSEFKKSFMNRRPSYRFEHVQKFLRHCFLSLENTISWCSVRGWITITCRFISWCSVRGWITITCHHGVVWEGGSQSRVVSYHGVVWEGGSQSRVIMV